MSSKVRPFEPSKPASETVQSVSLVTNDRVIRSTPGIDPNEPPADRPACFTNPSSVIPPFPTRSTRAPLAEPPKPYESCERGPTSIPAAAQFRNDTGTPSSGEARPGRT